MAFIRVQKLVRDGNGNILSGSAAIKESQYIKNGGKFHSRQIVRERLGNVIWLASDGKSYIEHPSCGWRHRIEYTARLHPDSPSTLSLSACVVCQFGSTQSPRDSWRRKEVTAETRNHP